MLFLALTPLIVVFLFAITMLILLMFDIDLINIHGEMNRLYKCGKCDLVYRKYQRLLIGDKKCPHCNKETYNWNYIYRSQKEFKYKYPFAPKVSILKALKLERLLKNNEANEFLDKQIEKYLKVQESKWMEMKEKKDELVKSGAFDK